MKIKSSSFQKTLLIVIIVFHYVEISMLKLGMYFKYGQKNILEDEIKKAIPAFLHRGLLITNVQEALNGTHDSVSPFHG